MATNPPTSWSPPSGTRDFVGDELRLRHDAIRTITRTFQLHGFDPLETPAFERVELLTGKYGEDEKLIFKIAGRGAKKDEAPELALRYDLTVPLARFAASHRDLTARGFRSYRVGPVWRADRPARGRFREFLQCDVDIVGSDSLTADADVELAIAAALRALGIEEFTIHLNSRKVLSGLVHSYGIPRTQSGTFFVAIDKLQKIGPNGVVEELHHKGVAAESIALIEKDLHADDPAGAALARVEGTEAGAQGLREVRRVEELVRPSLPAGRLEFDPFIARGLDYYTGPVFEVFLDDPDTLPLSIASGGRYDTLVESLSGHPAPACGGSLGFERLLLILSGNTASPTGTEALVTVWDDTATTDAMAIATELRRAGVATEVSLKSGNLGGQLKYAAQRDATVAVICGPTERDHGSVTVKNLVVGTQTTVARHDVATEVRAALG